MLANIWVGWTWNSVRQQNNNNNKKNLWLQHESRYDCTFNEMIIAVLSGRHTAEQAEMALFFFSFYFSKNEICLFSFLFFLVK